MPYIKGRVVHDADSHVMEIPGWLDEFGTARVRDAFNAHVRRGRELGAIVAQHDDPAYRARDADEIMARKNYMRPAPPGARTGRSRST